MCAPFVLPVFLPLNGLNHSRCARGGDDGRNACEYVGTKAFGDSWPNVVIVGDKEILRWEDKGREGEEIAEEGREKVGRNEKFKRDRQIFAIEQSDTKRCI